MTQLYTNENNNLSIIIPYYKGEKFIYKCINSILNSYNQSRKKLLFEVIVVIDSPEEYLENNLDLKFLFSEIDLKILINKKNSGVAYSRNRGLSESKHNFVTFIDQDDCINYNYFDTISNYLNDDVHCIIYNGYFHYISNDNYSKLYFIKPDLSIEAVLKQHYVLWTPGLMIVNKKKVQISNFFIDVSDNLRGCDDWAGFINMLLMYPDIRFSYISNPIYIINKHAANFSHDVEQMYLCQIAVLNYFKRKMNLKQQRVINQLIDIRTFELKRYTDKLSRKAILLKHTIIYFKYLCNKWIYLRYPSYKLKKTWYALFGERNIITKYYNVLRIT
jgi:glycosyltransferase involved in cell wall biosynthesis